MAIQKIVSGGQTGADRGGLDAALELGVMCGGWCPLGRIAEDGAVPPEYPLKEAKTSDYPTRTRMNVCDSDGTVVFTYGAPERGSLLTLQTATKMFRPKLQLDLVRVTESDAAAQVRAFVEKHQIQVLNVAGNRESKAPGIQRRVAAVMRRVLEALGEPDL